MLAAGAIVLGYGVIGSFIGLCGALIVANKANKKTIYTLNIVLAVFIVLFWLYFLVLK